MIGDCAWCEKEDQQVHRHHFPIQKKDGGGNTVKICVFCHANIHGRVVMNLMDAKDPDDYIKKLVKKLWRCVGATYPKLSTRDKKIVFSMQDFYALNPHWMWKI